MPRLKLDDKEFDPDELDVEYSDSDFQTYEGEIPPTGTMLLGRWTKLWWTYSGNGDPMIKALFVAEDNEDELEEYNGLPVWENLTFTPSAAFKYQPWLEVTGLSLALIKTKLYVAEDDDNIGTPIERIGTWKPGSDEAWAIVTVKKDRYNGAWQAKASKFSVAEEEAEEEEAPPPKASRKPAASASAAKHRRTRKADPEPEPEDEEEPEDLEEDEEEPEEEEEAPTTKRKAPASRSRTATRTKARPAKRGRTSRAKASDDGDDEPPF